MSSIISAFLFNLRGGKSGSKQANREKFSVLVDEGLYCLVWYCNNNESAIDGFFHEICDSRRAIFAVIFFF